MNTGRVITTLILVFLLISPLIKALRNEFGKKGFFKNIFNFYSTKKLHIQILIIFLTFTHPGFTFKKFWGVNSKKKFRFYNQVFLFLQPIN